MSMFLCSFLKNVLFLHQFSWNLALKFTLKLDNIFRIFSRKLSETKILLIPNSSTIILKLFKGYEFVKGKQTQTNMQNKVRWYDILSRELFVYKLTHFYLIMSLFTFKHNSKVRAYLFQLNQVGLLHLTNLTQLIHLKKI